MEDVLKQALPEVTETVEAAPALPPVEPQGGGVPVKSIGAILIAAVAVYIVGRIFCKK
tara:strand:+ start:279 stop:452 length:174 start_codon:yes stop_codon:yes gene_type:complete